MLGVTDIHYPREYRFYIGGKNSLYEAISGLVTLKFWCPYHDSYSITFTSDTTSEVASQIAGSTTMLMYHY
jgi:hypothetical protein